MKSPYSMMLSPDPQIPNLTQEKQEFTLLKRESSYIKRASSRVKKKVKDYITTGSFARGGYCLLEL